MKVLSLFDGISGAQQALKDLGITPEAYYASEIDKYAISVTMKNFPNTIQLGDVRSITKEMVGEVDLYVAGFPCTDLSIAKANRLGLAGERSGLFYEALRILREVKPKYFLIENVASMSKDDKNIITKELGVEPIIINSSLLSAQQRKRIYWTNISNVTQPEDQHIYLKDIIESGDVDKLKSYCIDASYYKGTNLETYLNKAKRQLVFEKPDFVGGIESSGRKKWLDDGKELSRNYSQGQRVYSLNGKSPTLSANGGGLGAKTGLYVTALTETRTEQAKEMRRKIRQETGKDYCSRRDKELVPRKDDKANCLTTGQTKESLIIQDFVVRKLTPLECERLQTFPDNYTQGVSNTQRYKALGNSFTVKVIAHILSFMELKK